MYGSQARQLKRHGVDSTYGSIETWAKENAWPPSMSVVDRDHAVRLVLSEVVPSEQQLLLVYTTPKLLRHMVYAQNLRNGGVICADATYKVCKTGHCVYMIGTVDVGQRYHTIGVAIATKENTCNFVKVFKALKEAAENEFGIEVKPKYGMSDACSSIANAGEEAFPGIEWLTCYSHIKVSPLSYLVR